MAARIPRKKGQPAKSDKHTKRIGESQHAEMSSHW